MGGIFSRESDGSDIKGACSAGATVRSQEWSFDPWPSRLAAQSRVRGESWRHNLPWHAVLGNLGGHGWRSKMMMAVMMEVVAMSVSCGLVSKNPVRKTRTPATSPPHRSTATPPCTVLLCYYATLGIRDADDCTGQAPPRRYHLVQHHGRPDDECGSGVTGDDLSSEIASMTRTARPDRTTSIPLVRLTTSATPNPRPVP